MMMKRKGMVAHEGERNEMGTNAFHENNNVTQRHAKITQWMRAALLDFRPKPGIEDA